MAEICFKNFNIYVRETVEELQSMAVGRVFIQVKQYEPFVDEKFDKIILVNINHILLIRE